MSFIARSELKAQQLAADMGRATPSNGQKEFARVILNDALAEVFRTDDDDLDLPWAVMDIGATVCMYIGRKGGEMGNIQIKIVKKISKSI